MPKASALASSTVINETTPVFPSTIPALTPVSLEIGMALSSKISKRSEVFPLRLAAPIIIDGHVLVPAGAQGTGEVIEAKHSGMSGSSGVLILAANYLTVDGRQLRLRSLHIAQAGADNRKTAFIIGATPFVGPLGLFINGGDTLVAAGTVAQAKTAEGFVCNTSTIHIQTTLGEVSVAPRH